MSNDTMALIQKNFIENRPYINSYEIQSFDFRRKQNGEMIGIVRTLDGTTHIKTISPNGTEETTMIKIPVFATLYDRDMQILKFYEKYKQADIAVFMGMSQSQISYIINKYKNS